MNAVKLLKIGVLWIMVLASLFAPTAIFNVRAEYDAQKPAHAAAMQKVVAEAEAEVEVLIATDKKGEQLYIYRTRGPTHSFLFEEGEFGIEGWKSGTYTATPYQLWQIAQKIDTVGMYRPNLPAAMHGITVKQWRSNLIFVGTSFFIFYWLGFAWVLYRKYNETMIPVIFTVVVIGLNIASLSLGPAHPIFVVISATGFLFGLLSFFVVKGPKREDAEPITRSVA